MTDDLRMVNLQSSLRSYGVTMHTLRINTSFPAFLLPRMNILPSDGDSRRGMSSTSRIAVGDMSKILVEMTHGC